MNEYFVPMIDSSHWQFDGTGAGVDWKKAAAAGVKVNMIRAGRGMNDANGTTSRGWDRSLLNNYRLSTEAGLKWTCYWRPDHLGAQAPERQAHEYCDAVESLPTMTTAPIVIDVETYTGPQLDLSAERDWFCRFRDQIERRGFHVAVYTGLWHWNNEVKLAWGDLDLLIANWPKPDGIKQLTPTTDAYLWPSVAFGGAATVGADGPPVPDAFPTWASWQFTADHGLGKTFGAFSPGLDCNIMKLDTYLRWFG